MAIRIAVCDKNRKDICRLLSIISQCDPLKAVQYTVAEFGTGESLLSCFNSDPNCFDIVLLEIILGSTNGVDIARSIRSVNEKCSIIFTTASMDYAMVGYEVFATGYLVKPFNKLNFEHFMKRAIQMSVKNGDDKPLVVKVKQEYITLFSSNLVFAESILKNTYLHLADGSTLKILMPIDELLSSLDGELFIKSHKSFIVNMNYITNVQPFEFTLGSFGNASITQRKYPQTKKTYVEYVSRGSALRYNKNLPAEALITI